MLRDDLYDIWTKWFIFPDLFLTWIKIIHNSLTIPGFPWFLVKNGLFTRFSKLSVNLGIIFIQGKHIIKKFFQIVLNKRENKNKADSKNKPISKLLESYHLNLQ